MVVSVILLHEGGAAPILLHEGGAAQSPQSSIYDGDDVTPDRLQAMSTERSDAVYMLLRPGCEIMEELLDGAELADTWIEGASSNVLEILTIELKCRIQQITDEDITRNIECAEKIVKKFGNVILKSALVMRGIDLLGVDTSLASGQSIRDEIASGEKTADDIVTEKQMYYHQYGRARARIRRVLLRHSLALLRRAGNTGKAGKAALEVEMRIKTLNAKNKGR